MTFTPGVLSVLFFAALRSMVKKQGLEKKRSTRRRRTGKRAPPAAPVRPGGDEGLWLQSPVPGARVSSPYGWRTRPSGPDLHTGVDFAAPRGSPVYAAAPGRVVVVSPTGQMNKMGNAVVVQHADRVFTLYGHLDSFDVGLGDIVGRGERIGTVGITFGTRRDPGRVFASSGAHVHFELLNRWPPAGRDKNRVDPTRLLEGM